ncbi:gamma carbonic anhydrase family protein [Falsirhodobacter halotolerans]|uniref:gamma carbonic anhydrase family protein n=1 Tax=Falsirhodobacter halotolerans TaxID=1146892 RepID=UPI001FD1DE28|nr:gamma carbonic anhydrase family protein [Falsirhodobacter halotolerans]MCJ8139724.1 gamma carbonic anhydrase family protein [Falsirhodobacter halotolerans]
MIHALGDRAPSLPASGDLWIAPGAQVVGRVTLADGVGIWFGAVLRGDNDDIRIDAGTNIQDNCVLHTDLGFPLHVGAGCTVGHRAILHGCTIGDGTLVGMGAVVMNGARIGRECLIGANALVTEGKEIPDGSLVMGSPARVVRPLTDAERAGLGRSAQAYVANMVRFRDGLRPL